MMSQDQLVQFVRAGLSSEEARSIDVSGIDGVYQDVAPSISLRVGHDDSRLGLTFAHEMGHYTWQHVLTNAQRQQYCTLYKSLKAQHCLVTAYCCVSVEEGFAEAFSYYIVDPGVLHSRDEKSNAFIESAIPN